MKRRNGWGDDDNDLNYELSKSALGFLEGLVGKAKRLPDATLEAALATVPESRLPQNGLYSIDPEERLRHARGQSLPDWLALRSGKLRTFPDAVAFPESSEAVQALLKHAQAHQIDVIP